MKTACRSINNHSSLILLGLFLLLSKGLSVEFAQGDCKFCSTSHIQITIIAVAVDLLAINQQLLVGNEGYDIVTLYNRQSPLLDSMGTAGEVRSIYSLLWEMLPPTDKASYRLGTRI